MDASTLTAFVAELEKQALSAGTLKNYIGARAAQGVGGAAALGKSMAGSTAQTSRQAVQGMSGLQKHRLKGVTGEGAQLHRKMQADPARVGLAKTTQETRGRVGTAIQQEAAGAKTRAGAPLSKAYEGYMTSSPRPYTPQHVEQVMGLKPGQGVLKGPSAGPLGRKPAGGAADATVASGVRPKAPATIDPLADTQISQVAQAPRRAEVTAVSRPRRRFTPAAA